ncbi:uncharacterized protein [Cicer arietinum]|uniref:Uncharacterized protein LOC101507621 isoform X1 n=1 Tax=Cicer arietinum TaxID=3827 RepID=A0A1S2YHQ9_CICAR|nr:uncharacterized protein LOC101507621 isoform X1 [Cicer arietinum]
MTDTLAATVSNGLTSASHEIPVTVGNNGVAVMMHQHNDSASTSVAPRAMNLNMAETLVHGPPRSHTPPQLSVSTQKLEELALKQSRLLIPMTPSTPRSLAASSFDKLKVKTRQLEYPFSHSHSPSHSQHGAHPSSQIQKTTSGNSYDVSASRELNGVSLAAKDNLSPNGSRVVLSNATTSAWITLEKRPTFQTQSRSDFLKNLSKKSSSKDTSCSLENSEASTRNDTNCLTQKSRDAPLVDISVVNSLTEHSSNITAQNGNVLGEPLKYSSNEEQQYITKPIFHSEDEEIAFLRSLGWEEGSEDDEGLTDEEIRDFYEKYGKLQQ